MLWRGGADPGDPHDRDGGVLELGADGVPEMLDLVARTRPGPFRPRTRVMGTYLGIRENGRLVAMAGERPFLHVAEQNTGAIALYERLGFEVRKRVTFRGFRTP